MGRSRSHDPGNNSGLKENFQVQSQQKIEVMRFFQLMCVQKLYLIMYTDTRMYILYIFCDTRHHGLSQSHNRVSPQTMTIKNFLFSTVPNILYELGASVKVGSLAKWVNLNYVYIVCMFV